VPLRELTFFILMIVSIVMIVYELFSTYKYHNYRLLFFCFLLVLSLGLLLYTMHLRINELKTELENTRRLVFVNMGSFEKRIEEHLSNYLKILEDKLNELGRRIYR